MKTMKISFFPRSVHVFFSLKCSPPHVHNESRNDQGPSHIPPRIRGFLARSGMLPRVFSTVQITETIPRKRENFYDTRWGGGDTYKATFPVTFLKLTHRTRVKVEIKHPWNIYPASILSSLSPSGWSTFFPSNFIRVSTVETNYRGISLLQRACFQNSISYLAEPEKTSIRNLLFAPKPLFTGQS